MTHIKSNLQKDQTNHSRTKEALQERGRLFYCSSKVSNHRTQLWGVQASQWKGNAFISQRTEKDLHDTGELGKWKGTILQASKSRKTSSQETHLVNNPSNKPATKASNCISRTSTSTTTSKYLKCSHLTFIVLHYSSIWLQLLNAQKCLVSPRNQISDYYSSKHLYQFCQFQPNILRQMATQSPMKQVKRNKDTINKPSIFQGQISRKKIAQCEWSNAYPPWLSSKLIKISERRQIPLRKRSTAKRINQEETWVKKIPPGVQS